MSEQQLFLILGGYGFLCAAVGVLLGFFLTRNHWRDEMIRRGHARYHWMNAKWYWTEDEPKPPTNLKNATWPEVKTK